MINNFSFTRLKIPDLYTIAPFFSQDPRGYFIKHFESNIFKDNGINFTVSESFESMSVQNVLRGLHFQTRNPQAKLVRVIFGEIWDVAVDLRKSSPTYLKWTAQILSDENRLMFYIPPGFAHGFYTLSAKAVVSYNCASEYDKETDTGIIWNDPDLNIDWPIPDGCLPILSKRDERFKQVKNMSDELFKMQLS